MGGTASLVAASQDPDLVDGVISVSAPVDFEGMNALAAAENLQVPALFLVASDDDPYYAHAQEMSAAADASLEIYPPGSGTGRT